MKLKYIFFILVIVIIVGSLYEKSRALKEKQEQKPAEIEYKTSKCGFVTYLSHGIHVRWACDKKEEESK